MHRQSGNFLLQSLLALTLVFAFIPFVARRLVARDMDEQMYSAATHIETVQTAARIYIRENALNLPYETTILSGDELVDVLEPYGLPLGFIARDAFGQDICLVITKNLDMVSAYLDVTGGTLSELQRAELARRIGFYAVPTNNGVQVGIALDDVYSDIVQRNEVNTNNTAFLTNLDMGGFSLDNAGGVSGRRGEFETGQINTLTVAGTENGRKERSHVDKIVTSKTVFQSSIGESALSLTRGVLYADSVNGRTVSKFGDTGNLTTNSAAMYEFSMTAGHSSFTGPEKWTVRGNVVADKINFKVEQLEINSFINAARGQTVYIDSETLEYSPQSGLSTDVVRASNITLRDQISNSLAGGGSGAVVIDVRLSGTSVLPDVLVEGINNDNIKIIKEPGDNKTDFDKCNSVVQSVSGKYSAKSLSQYIICQYMFWQRLEQRINIKKCLQDGGSDCD